jgi:hypothetical protein
MYTILLPLHNILRWVLLAAALFAVIRALAGWLGKKGWTPLDQRAGFWFTMAMDLQVLAGLLLYFLSPTNQTALSNFAGAMQNEGLRFFAVEHSVLMIVALALAHMGRAFSRKAESALGKHRRAAIWFGLALLVVLVAIPWPFGAVPRPWIRF